VPDQIQQRQRGEPHTKTVTMRLAEAFSQLQQRRPKIPVYHCNAKQLAQLPGDNAERNAVEETDQNRT